MFIDKQAAFADKSASGLTPELRQLMQRRDVPKKDWALPSGRAIAFAHSLVVPAGKHVGKPLRLSKPQIEFIRDVYNPRDKDGLRKRRQAIFSVGRRNGKTLLAAVIILLHLVGPFKRSNSVIASAATTRKQAGIVYRFVAKMIRLNPVLMKRLKLVESTKHVTHRRDGSFYSAIAAEAGGQFGEGLDLVVYDELAQAKNAALYDVLMTSLGAPGRAADDDHLDAGPRRRPYPVGADRLRPEDPHGRDRGRYLHCPPLRRRPRLRAA
ncbi:terminase large subunit [Sinorhizobium fredii]|uniref:terminase large subunit domain-containing protein n=1 Tax=Rhizobium fredii TaxID=380 RepID=UPI00309FD274